MISEESILNKDIVFLREEIKAYLLFELNFAEVLYFIVNLINTLYFTNKQCCQPSMF